MEAAPTRVRYRFRDKLVLAFALLLAGTVIPVLILVNTQINTISERKIEEELVRTQAVFQRFQRTQLKTYSEKASAFILTQPDIRAEIASTGESSESLFGDVFAPRGDAETFPGLGGAGESAAAPEPPIFGALPRQGDPETFRDSGGAGRSAAAPEPPTFGALTRQEGAEAFPGPAGAGLPPAKPHEPMASEATTANAASLGETQARILSIVEGVGLFQESEVFFLTDFQGRLLFSKADPGQAGELLSGIPDVLAALGGNEIFTWWGSADTAVAAARLLPRGGSLRLYQLFLKPVAFQGEVKGLMAIGFAVGAPELADILGITRAEIAFIANDTLYLNSLAGMPSEALLALERSPRRAEGSRMLRFTVGEEEFLALPVPMESSLGNPVGEVLVYRSKTREKEVFNRLRQTLNGIGVAALALAAALAYLISHNVSGALRQLFAGVREVRGGNLDVRLAIRTRDEFGALGEDFNEMAKGLKEKEAIRDTFKRYVSSSVVDELLRNMDDLKLGGETKHLTIQFSDIAAFTSLSETLSPEEVIAFLNEYLSAMTAEIEHEGGIVDKYIGDAVMAFWGAPVSLPDHPARACRAALAQISSLERLRAQWAGRGALERFAIRIGLHSGDVVVGNIGSNTRMDYTIIGDAVNTASRLEGMNKVYGTGILISENVRRQVGEEFVTRELDLIRPVGRAAPVRIFELVCGREGAPTRLAERHARFGEGLAHYRARRFAEALASFEALQADGADPPAREFALRCRAFLADPPLPDWDGVFVPTTK